MTHSYNGCHVSMCPPHDFVMTGCITPTQLLHQQDEDDEELKEVSMDNLSGEMVGKSTV